MILDAEYNLHLHVSSNILLLSVGFFSFAGLESAELRTMHGLLLEMTLLYMCQIIIKMAAANGVRRIWVGQNGLLSTPAVSAVIRDRVGHDVSISFAFLLWLFPPMFQKCLSYFNVDTDTPLSLSTEYRDLRQMEDLFWLQVTTLVDPMRLVCAVFS